MWCCKSIQNFINTSCSAAGLLHCVASANSRFWWQSAHSPSSRVVSWCVFGTPACVRAHGSWFRVCVVHIERRTSGIRRTDVNTDKVEFDSCNSICCSTEEMMSLPTVSRKRRQNVQLNQNISFACLASIGQRLRHRFRQYGTFSRQHSSAASA